MLQSLSLQRVRHDLVTEQQQQSFRVLFQIWTWVLLGRLLLVVGFPFITLNIYILPLHWPAISAEKSAANLVGIPMCVIYSFSLAAFNIFPLYSVFVILTNMCLIVLLLGCVLYETLWASQIWVAISFPMLGRFSFIISWNIFSGPYLLFLWPYNSNVLAFSVIPEDSEFVLISFHSFFFILLLSSYFHHSVFHLTLFVLLLQLVSYWFLLLYFSFQLFCFHLCLLVLYFF